MKRSVHVGYPAWIKQGENKGVSGTVIEYDKIADAVTIRDNNTNIFKTCAHDIRQDYIEIDYTRRKKTEKWTASTFPISLWEYFCITDLERQLYQLHDTSYANEVTFVGEDFFNYSTNIIEIILDKIVSYKNHCPFDHITLYRVNTNAFISNPKKFDIELCKCLNKLNSIVITTEFRHPDELSADVVKAIKQVQNAGIPVYCKVIIEKGLNDSYPIFSSLYWSCIGHGVLPRIVQVNGKEEENLVNDWMCDFNFWYKPSVVLVEEN